MITEALARRARPWIPWLLLFFGFLAIGLFAFWRYLPYQTQLSQYDEYVFVDYLDKATRGDIVQQGEEVNLYAVELAACRGVKGFGLLGPPCEGPYDVSVAPYGGISSAAVHSPVYFYVTALLTVPIRWTPMVDDLLVAGRLASVVWLAAGLTAVVRLATIVGASRTAGVAVALLLLAAPATRLTNTFITPDSMNYLVGALVLIVALRVSRRNWHPIWLVAAASLAVTVKGQNLLVVGTAAVFLLFEAWAFRREPARKRRLLWTAAAAVLGAAATQAAWLGFVAMTAVGPPADQELQGESASWANVAREAVKMMRGVVLGGTTGSGSPTGEVVAWLLTGGVVATTMFALRLSSEVPAHLGRSTAVALVVGVPVLYVLVVVLGSGFPLPTRYAMSLLPAMAACTASVFASRRVAAGVLVFGVGSTALLLASPPNW
jgi:hypothetical protein